MPPFQVPFDSGDVQFTRLVFDGLLESWPGTWDQTDRVDESGAESSSDTRQPASHSVAKRGPIEQGRVEYLLENFTRQGQQPPLSERHECAPVAWRNLSG
jgi:hypothetical protein